MRRPPAAFLLVPLVLAPGCGTVDPAVPLRLPEDDYVVGVSAGIHWDEAATLGSLSAGRGARPGGAIDVGWLDGVFGLHGAVFAHGEREAIRVGARLEATAWYGLLFGLGVRVGGLVGDPEPFDLSFERPVPAPADLTVDLTALIAVPIPLWHDCEGRAGALVLLPYARPGLRLPPAVAAPEAGRDDVRGFHEVGLSLRWTSFAF